MVQPDDVVPVTNLAPADWLVEQLRGWGRVRDLVPAGYEAYVRVPDEQGSLWLTRDVLAGHTRGSDKCWFAIWEGWPLPDKWRTEPTFHLPDRDLLLFAGTFDDLDVVAIEFGCAITEFGGSGSRLHVPGRTPTAQDHRMAAAHGRQQRQHQRPSLWWPEKRSWVVGNEVNSDATYVGGSRSLAADLLAVDSLQATEIEPGDRITIEY